ncbi:hypothetical protein GN278_01245 [Rhodobacteraceae bacterium Araon29]
MLLEIFDVEHGACALVTTSNGRRALIDCGHNATTGWYPGTALANKGVDFLDRLFITNFDEDHVSGIRDLQTHVYIQTLVRNPTVGVSELYALKSQNGMGPGVRTMAQNIQRVFIGGPPTLLDEADFGDTVFRTYYNSYGPYGGFLDSNNLSMVVFVSCGGHKIVFPGDMEKAGWQALLSNPAFRRDLSDVTLFVASHHGRENGLSHPALSLCQSIQAVIISDQHLGYQSQETVAEYRKYARGIEYDGKLRRVLTTRSDASMRFELSKGGGGHVRLNMVA